MLNQSVKTLVIEHKKIHTFEKRLKVSKKENKELTKKGQSGKINNV